jgi:hypothetical protein
VDATAAAREILEPANAFDQSRGELNVIATPVTASASQARTDEVN